MGEVALARAVHKGLSTCGKEIERELEEYFRAKRRDTGYHEFVADLYERLEAYVLRKGTRLASCITLLIYNAYKSDEGLDNEILKVCAGLELYRHAILIHDDLVDRDDLRRGDTTFHKLFGARSRRFGESAGLFAGNILYSLALDCILKSAFERELLYDSMRVLNTEYCNVNESQMLDVLFEHKEPDEAEWYRMASKRAGSLFRAAMLIGAVLSNAPAREKELLTKIAEHMGYAFDIRDDIMGTFGTEDEYGRKPEGDLRLFKKPLHLIYTLSNARGADNLSALLKTDDFEGIRGLIRAYGLERAKDKSREHAQTALSLIEQTAMNAELKQVFRAFISYSMESLDRY